MRFCLDIQKVDGYDYGQKTAYNDKHLGVDWEAKFVPLYAPKDGKILNILTGTQSGKTIWFQPKGETTLVRWIHLDKWLVNKGQEVKEGQQLAVTGKSGSFPGSGAVYKPHLHEDIWPKGKVTLKFKDTINPHKYYMQNQTKIVKSKFSATLYKCTPIPDIGMDDLQKIANVEGFDIPDPVPDTDSLK